jgi:hypothetical protein
MTRFTSWGLGWVHGEVTCYHSSTQFGPFEHSSKHVKQFTAVCFLISVWQETVEQNTKTDRHTHSIPNMTLCFNKCMSTCILHISLRAVFYKNTVSDILSTVNCWKGTILNISFWANLNIYNLPIGRKCDEATSWPGITKQQGSYFTSMMLYYCPHVYKLCNTWMCCHVLHVVMK